MGTWAGWWMGGCVGGRILSDHLFTRKNEAQQWLCSMNWCKWETPRSRSSLGLREGTAQNIAHISQSGSQSCK